MVHYLHQQEMLQRLPIAFAQVKAGSTSDNLLTEIKQMVYSLLQAKEMSKKVFNNLIKLIIYQMKTIFTNSENKIDTRRGEKSCCIIKS